MANEIDFKKLEKEIENATKQTKNFTEELKDLTKELSSLSSSGRSPSFIGGLASTISDLQTISDSIGTTISAVGELSSTISNLGSSSSSSISGIANSFSNIPGAIGSVIGIVTSIGTAIYDVYQTCLQNDINRHFGNITLSAQQLKQAAEDLTRTDWDVKINAVLSASTETETLQTDLQENVNKINQYNWRVGVGLTLTDEEKQDYKKTVEDYVSNLSGYLNQQWYTTNLAINVLFGTGSPTGNSIQQATDSAFQGLNSQTATLTQELNNMVIEALNNNTINDPNVQQAISNKIAEIQEVVNHVADTKYRVQIEQIYADIEKGGLTRDSFSGLQEELTTALDEKKQELENSKVEALVGLEIQLEAGKINKQEYEDLKEQIELNASKNIGDITLDTIKIQIKGFEQVWGDELKKGKSTFESDVTNWLDSVDFSSSERIKNQLNDVYIRQVEPKISAPLRTSINEFLESLQPQTANLESLAKTYTDLGQTIPKWVADGLASTYELKALTGDMDARYQYFAYQIAQDRDNFQSFVEKIDANQIDPAFKSAIELFGGGKFDDKGVWNDLIDSSEASIPEVQGRLLEQGVIISDTLAEVLGGLAPSVQEQAMNLVKIFTLSEDEKQKEMALGKLAEMGIAMNDAVSYGMYQNMGFAKIAGSDMITMFNTATGEKVAEVTPDFVKKLSDMGFSGLLGMQQVINGNPLSAPDLKDIDASKWATDNIITIQNAINNKPVTVKMVAGELMYASAWKTNPDGSKEPIFWTHGKPTGHANGGFVDKEQLSWIAEGDKPEVVIPLDPGKRTRAMQLFAQTSELLGVSVQARNGFPLGDSLSPSTSVVDYSRLAALITDSLKSSSIQCNPVFQVSQGDVYLDSEKAGRALTPVISRIQAKTAKFETR